MCWQQQWQQTVDSTRQYVYVYIYLHNRVRVRVHNRECADIRQQTTDGRQQTVDSYRQYVDVYIYVCVCISGLLGWDNRECVDSRRQTADGTQYICVDVTHSYVLTADVRQQTVDSTRQCVDVYIYVCMCISAWLESDKVDRNRYGVATVSRIDKRIGLFCRI